MLRLSANQIIDAVGGTVLKGSAAALDVTSVKEPAEAGPGDVVFLITSAFVKTLGSCRAEVLVVQEKLWSTIENQVPQDIKLVIGTADAYLGLAKTSALIAAQDPFADWKWESCPGGSSTSIHGSAKIHETAIVTAGATVCAEVKVGARTVILPNAVVGPGVTIGEDCVVFPGVVLYPRTQIGNRVRIHANAVLGADGFGYAPSPRGSVKIWHLGRVVIGNDVEIGANTCIDRGTLRDTVVEDGAKIDNLVQVGHNGFIGGHSILCAQVGLAGNVTVGKAAILAGQVGVADKMKIGDKAVVGPQAGIMRDVNAGDIVMMNILPQSRKRWWRTASYIDRIGDLFDRVEKLEKEQKK